MRTPLEVTPARRVSGKKLGVVAVLRAGLGMLDAVLDLIPVARVGFVGVYRDEQTLEPVEYYCKLPGDLAERDVLVLDPMLATGGSASEALALCKRQGAVRTSLLCVVAAPAGHRPDRRRPPRRGGLHGLRRPRAQLATATSCPASATPATACSAPARP